MRALEVAEATGKSILEFRKGKKEKRDFNIIKIGLELSTENLHRNINSRVDKMIRAGLVDEAKELLPYKYLNALQTVGYSEMFDYLEGKVSSHDAVELVKKNTRQYAKRQMTWFRKEKEIVWFVPDEVEKMKGHLQDALH
jgi:tRNA dimethylallyltransferase